MKAVLWDAPFSDPDWIFERKLDGIRCLAHRHASEVRLLSRTDRQMNGAYPELVAALEAQPSGDFVVDGEVVALDGAGITRFQRLQRRGKERVAVYLYVFDLLRLDGRDVRPLPLRERKALLRRALRFGDPIRYTPHRNEHGERLYAEACRKGLEGVIAKRADSPYRATRSRDWLKLKCHAEQELVIGGFTAPQGARTDFGALLVGYWEKPEPRTRPSRALADKRRLRYAGKVGTGFGRATLAELGAALRERERADSPFADVRPIPRGTHWVEPELVAQIGFSEWTRDGRLRHPRYIGLRDDKPARDVVRETPSS
jgi:bifunctional non-homologous end joining protein LigD